MTKELMRESKEYSVLVTWDTGKSIIEIDATVEVVIQNIDNWESDIRVISIDSFEDGEWNDDAVEKYILENWDKAEEIESPNGGG